MEFLPTGFLRNMLSEPYGLATPSGIVFLNKEDKFPRLTEEEERFHATLLGTTTFGLLQTVFDSFKINYELYEENLDWFYNLRRNVKNEKVDFVFFSDDNRTRIMQNPSTIEEESLNPDMNQNIQTKMKQNTANMYLKSTNVQETTAKYLSFRYAKKYYGANHVSELQKLLDIEMNTLSQLKEVSILLGNPLIQEDWFAANLLLLIGRISMSTGELNKISKIRKRKSIRNKLLKNDFWDRLTPDDRFELILKQIPRSIISRWHKRFHLLEKNLQIPFMDEDFVENIISYLSDILTKHDEVVDVYDKSELLERAIALTAHIKYALLGLTSTFFIDRTVSVYTLASGEVEPLPLMPYKYNDPFLADPSGVVFRKPRFCDSESIVNLSFDQFIELVEKIKPYSLLLAPVFHKDSQNGIAIYVFPRKFIFNQDQCSIHEENMPRIIKTHIEGSAISAIEDKLPTTKINWLFRTLPDNPWFNFQSMTSSMYKGRGNIVFIDLVNYYSSHIDSSFTTFYEGILSQFSRDWLDSSTQTYLGMIMIDKKYKFGRIADVPYYVRETFENHHRKIEELKLSNRYQKYDPEWPPPDEFDDIVEASVIAYESSYLYDLLPEELFNDYSEKEKEDIWIMRKKLFEK